METCILYLRKSDENADDDDFEIQEDITRAYAESKGYAVYAVYREAHSGKHSPMTRTVLRQAVNDIKAKRATVMVIRSYDRLARTQEQMWHIIFEVEEMYHGRIEAATEQLNRNDPIGKLQFAVMAAAAEIERNRIYDRMESGKKKRAQRGHLMGSPNPRYGYTWADDEPGKRTSYNIDPVTGPIVQRIFQMAAQGQSVRAIAKELNVQVVMPPSAYAAQFHNPGKRHVAQFWHAEQVRVILDDPRYAGKPVAFRYKTGREYREDKEYKVRALNDGAMELSTTVWPPLVTPEMYSAVHAKLKTNTAGRKPTVQALMRGHVICGCCGRKMTTGNIGSGKHVYICRHRPSNAATPEEACPGRGHNMRVALLDAEGWEGVKVILSSRAKFTELLRARFEQPSGEVQALVASAAGALRAKKEQQDALAQSIGMTTNDAVRGAIIAQMETVAEQVQKLELAYQEAAKHLDDTKAGEAWVQQTLDRIYGWQQAQQEAPYGFSAASDEQMADYDALPYELKRVAVEASGVEAVLYPVGWREAHKEVPQPDVAMWRQSPTGAPSRVLVRFNVNRQQELVDVCALQRPTTAGPTAGSLADQG